MGSRVFMPVKLILMLVCAISLSAVGWSEPNWNPKRSWALVVSVLEWKHSQIYPSFPTTNRRDERLVQALKVQGVPNGQIVLLQDKAATMQNIKTQLKKLLSQVQDGDTLWVYYAGHGYRGQRTKRFYMVPYDGNQTRTLWLQDESAEEIDNCGKRISVIWAADCCYSGCLADWAQKGTVRPRAALSSSSRELISTENWTFSDCLVDGLIGDPAADQNNDGQITFQEVGHLIEKEMLFIEGQSAGATASPAFPAQTVLVKTSRPKRKSEGKLVQVKYDGRYWKARVLEEQADKVFVHWVGTVTDYPDEWVPANTVKWPR